MSNKIPVHLTDLFSAGAVIPMRQNTITVYFSLFYIETFLLCITFEMLFQHAIPTGYLRIKDVHLTSHCQTNLSIINE